MILNRLLLFISKLTDSSQVKFCWFQTQEVFHEWFHLIFLSKFFCHSEYFLENKKDRNHLVQGLINIVDGVEQTQLNPICFLLDYCWMWLYVLRKSTTFLLSMRVGCFLRRFSCIHCSISEFKSVSNVWLQFKKLCCVYMWWSHYTHIFLFCFFFQHLSRRHCLALSFCFVSTWLFTFDFRQFFLSLFSLQVFFFTCWNNKSTTSYLSFWYAVPFKRKLSLRSGGGIIGLFYQQ